MAPKLGSTVRRGLKGLRECFAPRARVGMALDMRGKHRGVRMAVPIGKGVVHSRRADGSVCISVSLMRRVVRHRLHGCGGGLITHGRKRPASCTPSNGDFEGRFFSSRRRAARSSRIHVIHAGGFNVGPVFPRSTYIRVRLLKRGFFMFSGTRASRIGMMCGEGSNSFNLVRPRFS